MTRYQVALVGCDESTQLVMDLTDDERATIERLAVASRATSEYPCMPILKIEVASETEGDE